MPYVRICSLPFPLLSREEVIEKAKALAGRGEPAAVFTPNADMAERAMHSPAFHAVLSGADMLLPDGVGITLAARRQGVHLPRFPGIEFAEELLASPPRGGRWRLFLLGAKPGVAARAGDRLTARFPWVTVCGVQDGYFPTPMGYTVAAAIRAARPDLLFVGLGSPRQEEWIATHRLPCLAVGLGGAFDVWAGDARRAPAPVRRAGLEWAWRTVREPRRLSRLPAMAAFSFRVMFTKSASPPKKADKNGGNPHFFL